MGSPSSHDSAESTFTTDVQVRYKDLDTFQHVNNAVYVTYFEHARTAYLDAVLDVDVGDYGFVVASLEIDYVRPITLGDDVVVTAETAHVGSSSWLMAYEIVADGELAATGKTTQVFVDPDTKQSRPVPDDIRAQLVAYEGLEE